MTTGSQVSGVWPPPWNTSGFYANKSWDGANGRYELVGGRLRWKWNNYTILKWTYRWSKDNTYGYNLVLSGQNPQPPWDANDTLLLQSKLANAVRAHKFNLGIAVAEGSQTIALVRSTAVALASCIRSLKHGNFPAAVKALRLGNERHLAHRMRHPSSRMRPDYYWGLPTTSRNAAKDVSGRWLELQYGWLPLLNDVYESGQAFAAIANLPRKTRLKVSRKRSASALLQSAPYTDNYDCVVHKKYIHELEESLSVARSLGLMDPLAIAWEVIPFSFVADWFIPIGTYLDVLAVLPNLTGRTLAGTFVSTTNTGEGTQWPYYYGPATAKKTSVSYSRSISFGLTAQRPTFKALPAALSSGHIKNAVALITQVLLHK